MPQDVRDLTAFYDAPLGQLAHRAISREIHNIWPDLRNYRVLGYGFAIPYLRAFKGTERSIAAMPAPQGVVSWPEEKNSALLCEEDALPFPDVFFDRILIVHGLEASESLRALLAKDPEKARYMAMRSTGLQGGYFMVAARALGLDCGPMSGFDREGIDKEFFAGTQIKSYFLCNLGFGVPTSVRPRAARLGFDEACKIL